MSLIKCHRHNKLNVPSVSPWTCHVIPTETWARALHLIFNGNNLQVTCHIMMKPRLQSIIHMFSSSKHCKTHVVVVEFPSGIGVDSFLSTSVFGDVVKAVVVSLSAAGGALPLLRCRSSLSLCFLLSASITFRFWKISLNAWFMASSYFTAFFSWPFCSSLFFIAEN